MWTVTRAILFFLSFIFVTNAQAQVTGIANAPVPPGVRLHLLATITNNRNSDVHELNVEINPDQSVRGLYFNSFINSTQPPIHRTREFPLSELLRPKGATIIAESGHDVIYLFAQLGPQQRSADLVVRYLSNGLFNSYEDCSLKAAIDDSGEWNLLNAYTGKKLDQIIIQAWSLGVSTIENVCPQQ
jgi:hypothetical protein